MLQEEKPLSLPLYGLSLISERFVPYITGKPNHTGEDCESENQRLLDPFIIFRNESESNKVNPVFFKKRDSILRSDDMTPIERKINQSVVVWSSSSFRTDSRSTFLCLSKKSKKVGMIFKP